jgi:hypothetical protein
MLKQMTKMYHQGHMVTLAMMITGMIVQGFFCKSDQVLPLKEKKELFRTLKS